MRVCVRAAGWLYACWLLGLSSYTLSLILFFFGWHKVNKYERAVNLCDAFACKKTFKLNRHVDIWSFFQIDQMDSQNDGMKSPEIGQ